MRFTISNRMRTARNIVFGAGCLVSMLAPVAGIVLYPKANWLFAFVILGVGLIALAILTRKDPNPIEVAERAERLLNGTSSGWDVDDYEHLHPREPQLRELWQKTMTIGGLAEEWVRLDDGRKRELQGVIRAIR
jgi:type IV secretory pathway TrbD component